MDICIKSEYDIQPTAALYKEKYTLSEVVCIEGGYILRFNEIDQIKKLKDALVSKGTLSLFDLV